MTVYRVKWDVLVDATDMETAAKEARMLQLESENAFMTVVTLKADDPQTTHIMVEDKEL